MARNISRALLIPSGATAAVGSYVGRLRTPYSVTITGTFTATFNLEGSADGTNFVQLITAATAAGVYSLGVYPPT